MTRVFANVDELCGAVGQHLGFSSWTVIDEATLRAFTQATTVNSVSPSLESRAASDLAGARYLMLALIPKLMSEVIQVRERSFGLNYGLNWARFEAAVTVGARVRCGVALASTALIEGGVQVAYEVALMGRASTTPVCVAETIARIYR